MAAAAVVQVMEARAGLSAVPDPNHNLVTAHGHMVAVAVVQVMEANAGLSAVQDPDHSLAIALGLMVEAVVARMMVASAGQLAALDAPHLLLDRPLQLQDHHLQQHLVQNGAHQLPT